MARKPTEQEEIQRLIRLSSEAREQLGTRVAQIRNGLNLPSRALGSMRHRAKTWLVGSMVAGFLTSLLMRKTRKGGKRKKGLPTKMVALTLTAARPMMKTWALGRLRKWGKQRLAERLSASRKPKPSPFQVEPEPAAGPPSNRSRD